MIRKLQLFISLLPIMVLTACVDLKPVKTPGKATYILDTVSVPIKSASINYSLLVSLPKASPGLNDNQMAYMEQPYEIKYFARNRWIDAPANMLLPLIVQSLQNSERFHAVVSYPYSGDTDLRLDTELLVLQQEFMVKPSQVRLSMRAQLINLKTQRVIASKNFNILQTAKADNPYSGVIAANNAVAQFLTELNRFCIAYTDGQYLTKK